MNTNKQHQSDIDSTYPDDIFDNLSHAFWAEAKQAEDRQLMFRLLWLGEWLKVRNQWKSQFKKISPVEALHYAIIQRHGWLPPQISALTPQQISLSLTEEWTAFAGDQQGRTLQKRVERKLDALDSAFALEH